MKKLILGLAIVIISLIGVLLVNHFYHPAPVQAQAATPVVRKTVKKKPTPTPTIEVSPTPDSSLDVSPVVSPIVVSDTPVPPTPTPSDLITCTGPDGGQFQTTQEACTSFNDAWAPSATPTPGLDGGSTSSPTNTPTPVNPVVTDTPVTVSPVPSIVTPDPSPEPDPPVVDPAPDPAPDLPVTIPDVVPDPPATSPIPVGN